MHDAPDLGALLASVRGYIEDELLVALEDPRQRFRARVAAHVLAVAEREVSAGEEHLREEARRLAALLGEGEGASAPAPSRGRTAGAEGAALREELVRANRELARRLRDGSLRAEPGTRLWAHLRRITEDRLRVSNPAFLARAGDGGAANSRGASAR